MSSRGDVRKAIKELEQLGWEVTGGGGRHYIIKPPTGTPITVTCSPSDARAVTYFRRAVEKARKR